MKKQIKLIIGLIVLTLVVVLVVEYVVRQHIAPEKNVPTIAVTLGKATQIKLVNSIDSIGILTAINSTVISAKQSGYIKKILFSEGQYVRRNQALIELDNAQQKAALASAQANLVLTHNIYQRAQKLYKQNVFSQQKIETLRANYLQALDKTQASETALDNMILRASFNGYLGTTSASLGDYVKAGQPLATLINSRILRVEYSVSSQFISQMQLHQKAVITSSSLPGKQFNGYVSYIAQSINPETQTLTIHALINNPEDQLKPGLLVAIHQYLGGVKRFIVVPQQSVLTTLSGHYVFAIKNHKAFKIPVKTGQRIKQKIVILHGLRAKQEIVIAGQYQLQAGSAVHIVNNKKKP